MLRSTTTKYGQVEIHAQKKIYPRLGSTWLPLVQTQVPDDVRAARFGRMQGLVSETNDTMAPGLFAGRVRYILVLRSLFGGGASHFI